MTMKDRRWMLRAAGYLAFALFSLLVSLYLTFDYNRLKPLIKNRLESMTEAQVEVGTLSSYHVSGISINKLKMRFKAEAEDPEAEAQAPSTLTMEKIKVRLKILPLLIGRRSISFEALLAGGKMEGDLSTKKKGLKLNAEASNLMLERLPGLSLGARDFRLGGKMEGRVRLNIPDESDPSRWEGEMNLDLKQAKVYPFTYMSVEVPEIRFSSGEMQVKIDEGKANIDPLKLESSELPVDLKGTLELRNPLTKSFLDLSGTIKPSSGFQKSIPFITSVFSPSQPFSYKGNLDALLKTF